MSPLHVRGGEGRGDALEILTWVPVEREMLRFVRDSVRPYRRERRKTVRGIPSTILGGGKRDEGDEKLSRRVDHEQRELRRCGRRVKVD